VIVPNLSLVLPQISQIWCQKIGIIMPNAIDIGKPVQNDRIVENKVCYDFEVVHAGHAKF
jgi:hypothetical protein